MTPDGQDVFDAVYGEHHRAVHAYLLGRTSDPSAAGDLLQETFLRAWRRLDVLDGLAPDRQRAWLVTVARNLVTDRFRARATRGATHEALVREQRPPDPHGPGTAERVVAREELERLRAAIAALPEPQRVVLTMTTVAGMGSHEIGAALDLPAGTVRHRLHQARRRLAAQLDRED